MKNVSVVVPVYYGEHYISGIIRQIEDCKKYMGVGYQIEIVFVNDSPDTPLNLSWSSQVVNITIINSDCNAGIHGARVKGLMECIGEYILFLDQDDKIRPEYFMSQLQRIGENDAVICKALYGGRPVYSHNDIFNKIPSKDFMLKTWNRIVSPGQVLLRKSSIPKTWICNVMKYNGADDWLLWVCMVAENNRFSLNEEILYEHTMQNNNASDDLDSMLRSEYEMFSIVKKNKILTDDKLEMLSIGVLEANLERTRILSSSKRKLDLLSKWITLKEQNVIFSDYLRQLESCVVAIYGCGIIGEFLYQEIKKDVEVKCFIDRNAREIKKEIPVYMLQDDLPETDTVIITLTDGISDVECKLKSKGIKNIIVLKKWILGRNMSEI